MNYKIIKKMPEYLFNCVIGIFLILLIIATVKDYIDSKHPAIQIQLESPYITAFRNIPCPESVNSTICIEFYDDINKVKYTVSTKRKIYWKKRKFGFDLEIDTINGILTLYEPRFIGRFKIIQIQNATKEE